MQCKRIRVVHEDWYELCAYMPVRGYWLTRIFIDSWVTENTWRLFFINIYWKRNFPKFSLRLSEINNVRHIQIICAHSKTKKGSILSYRTTIMPMGSRHLSGQWKFAAISPAVISQSCLIFHELWMRYVMLMNIDILVGHTKEVSITHPFWMVKPSFKWHHMA